MRIVRSLDLPAAGLRGGAVTIGNFDGVHLGHARIISALLELARKVEGPAIVFTFDPHPVRLLRPAAAPPPLTWTERKAELLAELGVDAMIAYPTDEDLLRLTAEEFFQQIVRQRLDAKAMVEGPNFYFGRNRMGNIEVLEQFCRADDVRLEVVSPLVDRHEFVSSSRVRQMVAQGDVQEAARLLTRPYRIRGLVTHGARRGAKLGFPTANVDAIDTLLPQEGVYAGMAQAGDKTWPAAINIGTNPTFGEGLVKVEAHLLGYSGNLYGEPLELDFLDRLRDIQTFASVDDLKSQLATDVERTREIVSTSR